MSEHVCNWNSAWPIGHPLPPEDPDKLQGPEIGEPGVLYWNRYKQIYQPAKIIARSYVWSPGECRHQGGYRHYDWSVIETFDGERWYRVVVDDADLTARLAHEPSEPTCRNYWPSEESER